MRGSEYAQLRAFATIADKGNFARAAAELRMSASTLSQTIRELEERLGVRLLNRTTRSVALTDAGGRLLTRLRPALTEIQAAVEDVITLRDTPAGTLQVHTPRQAAIAFIEPILGSFHQCYPDVLLEITIDDAVIDIGEAGFDVGIRLGDLLERDVVAFKLGESLREIPVAAPSYLDARGHPMTPSDLHDHSCINWRPPGSTRLYNWRFGKDGDWFEVAVNGPLVVSHRDLAFSAAVQGIGIAFGMEHRALTLIRDGRVVPLLKEWCPSIPGWHIYYPKRRHTSLAVRAFVDFLRRHGSSRLASSS
jgi:DNA-binding transcriptional LysR family regulator